MAKFFIHRPVFAIVVSLIILIGFAAFAAIAVSPPLSSSH